MSPKPTLEDSTRFYQSIDPRMLHAADEADYWAEVPVWREPRLIHRELARLGMSQGRYLEVGAGDGRFTEYFHLRGYDCTPVEPNPLFAAEIHAKTGLPVRVSAFEDLSVPADAGGKWDIVLMAQVIEHVTDPRRFVLKAWECLKPGGLLVISTPNINSLLVRLLGIREGHVCPPLHLNFFSRRSLETLCAQVGFRPVRAVTASNASPRGCVRGVRRYLGRGHVLPEVLGAAAWLSLAGADVVGMGRYLYSFLSRGPKAGSA